MLPYKLTTDGWWLSDDDETPTVGKPPISADGDISQPPRKMAFLFLMAALAVLAADILIFDHELGLGLVIFSAFLAGAGIFVRQSMGQSSGRETLACLVLLLGLLPVLEFSQPLSLLFLSISWIIFIALVNAGSASLLARVFHAITRGYLRICSDFRVLYTERSASKIDRHLLGVIALDWMLPIIIGLIFLVLFLSANPVLEALSAKFKPLSWLSHLSLTRMGFWLIALVLIWPVLRFIKVPEPGQKSFPRLEAIRIYSGPALRLRAILNTLLVSNLLFLVQSGSDFSYLLAGAKLPEGMTYAQYAHRGAYPLLATALLAGGFATASAPFARTNRVVRLLSLFWMVQTLLLIGSSIFRLILYVEAYGLTLLRLWAGIWMLLVLLGIILVIWQIYRDKTRLWLIKGNGLLALATLYACCFFNFTAFVAEYNFRNLPDVAWAGYACSLGPQAAPAYFKSHLGSHPLSCFSRYLLDTTSADWREWSWREHRLGKSVSEARAEISRRLPDSFEWQYDQP